MSGMGGSGWMGGWVEVGGGGWLGGTVGGSTCKSKTENSCAACPSNVLRSKSSLAKISDTHVSVGCGVSDDADVLPMVDSAVRAFLGSGWGNPYVPSHGSY